jgi:hypothetical protein
MDSRPVGSIASSLRAKWGEGLSSAAAGSGGGGGGSADALVRKHGTTPLHFLVRLRQELLDESSWKN